MHRLTYFNFSTIEHHIQSVETIVACTVRSKAVIKCHFAVMCDALEELRELSLLFAPRWAAVIVVLSAVFSVLLCTQLSSSDVLCTD